MNSDPGNPGTSDANEESECSRLFREWQAEWHDAFDADPELKNNPDDTGRPDRLPDDVDCDFRLKFLFSHTTPETRARCFAVFPKGAEMYARHEEFHNTKNSTLPAATACEIVEEIARCIDAAKPDEQVNWSNVTVFEADTPEAEELYMECMRVNDLFQRDFRIPIPEHEIAAHAAASFLVEPLYTAAWNMYEPQHWITGVLFDPARDRIHELVYKLWKGNYQPLISEDGVVLRPLD